MIKVFINPYANDGILRVVEAQVEHLPKFGIEMVSLPSQADVICNHGTNMTEVPGIPIVNVNHGLYWSRQPWGNDFMDINHDIVTAMQYASAITAPSDWVNNAIRRGGYWYPETVHHGIDAEKFLPGNITDKYVLWNKARADYVSNPADLQTIAGLMRNTDFISTHGIPDQNLLITGTLTHLQMKKLVSEAGVYLATARETFGIGTLEAMAYGVPIAGWDWGGTAEIVQPGFTGYLAPPGDYKALAECIDLCFSERKRLSDNAIADVRNRWKWEPRIEQYANIFKRIHERYNLKKVPKVSIIVTAYKLDEFLPACLNSITTQSYPDFECLVVDDAKQQSTKDMVREYAKHDPRFRYISTDTNLGLPGARNFGAEHSKGKYIRHVDADDFLDENTIGLEATALDSKRGIDIVYGHLEVVRTDGSRILENGSPVRGGWPGEKFDWYQQMSHLNQAPSCFMARREMFEKSGGYRTRMYRNEDAEFLCRVTSLGSRAEKITQAVTYYHRERHDSKGAKEWESEGKEPDWTAWFPWRMGSTDYQQALSVLRKYGNIPPRSHVVPFGAQGKAPAHLRFWYVHDYAYPVVSIILTCGPGHKQYLLDALDSIQAQTYTDWECVVVNDSGEKWESDILGAPWAKVVNMDGNQGASAARNEGLKHTKGKFIIWMDADDYWLPWFLAKMVNYGENNSGVIYSDLLISEKEKEFKIYKYPEFNSELVPHTMQYPGSSILIPRFIVDAVNEFQGGFELTTPGMEDWDYQLAVHHLGFCAYHLPEPLFVYRIYTSTKRDTDYAKIEDIRSFMDNKWREYRQKEKKLMCGCNSPKKPVGSQPSSTMTSSGNFSDASINPLVSEADKQQMVMVEYIGSVIEPFSLTSKMSRNVRYRFANNDQHRIKTVFLGDAEFLLGQTGRDGKSIYRMIRNAGVEGANDPTEFLGQPIAV